MKAVSAQVVSCCIYDKPPILMPYINGNIQYMLDCWANLGVHLLLLKCSTAKDVKKMSNVRPPSKGLEPVWPVKNRQMSIKVAQKDFASKMKDLQKLPKMCWHFGQNNCCSGLWKVAQSVINHPIWSYWLEDTSVVGLLFTVNVCPIAFKESKVSTDR